MDTELEQLTDVPASLGEGPSWHEQEQVLYWIDILAESLHRYDPATGEDQSWNLGELVGTVAPRACGGLVVALQRGLAFFDPKTSELQRLPELDANPETRFNDGKCDPQGRLWVGTMDMVQEARPLGSLYCVEGDLQIREVRKRVTISNGLTWSPDQRTMYYIDSPTRAVVAYSFDTGSGNVEGQRTVVRFPPEDGFPDGMTSDADGMLWIAHWGGACVSRWDPDTGQLLARYPTPAPHTSACCFGGPGLSDLYITTARKGLTRQQLASHPGSGHLFRMKTGMRGCPTYTFAG
jgi:sugar lactone lactonase YvrE